MISQQATDGIDSGIRFIDPPIADPRTIAAEFIGKFTAQDMRAYVRRIEEIVEKNQKALILIDMRGYSGFELSAVAEKFKHLGMLWKGTEKMAVVGNRRWLKAYLRLVGPILPQQLKYFEHREQAWTWLTGSE